MLVASDFAAVSCAFFFWFRNSGMAIAARMPMMIMTTRSSMSVKPCSFSSIALRSRASIAVPPRDDVSPVKEARLLAEPDRGSWADHEGPLALRPHLAVGVPFLAVALMTTRMSSYRRGDLRVVGGLLPRIPQKGYAKTRGGRNASGPTGCCR